MLRIHPIPEPSVRTGIDHSDRDFLLFSSGLLGIWYVRPKLMTLLISRLYRIGWMMNWKRFGRRCRVRKTSKFCDQDRRCPDRDWNWVPPMYTSRTLHLDHAVPCVIDLIISNIFFHIKQCTSRSQRPHDLRHEPSSPARTVGSWIRIPLNAWMSLCVYSVFVLSCV
jgi:hypothetical protein